MQKKRFFSHDENALSDPKIMSMMSVYGFEGYGWFWAIIESLRQSDSFEINFTSKNYLNGLAYLLRTDKKIAEKFLLDCINEFDLFASDGDNFWSRSLKERMEFMNDKKQQYKENANKRWEKERQKQQEQAPEATSKLEAELDKPKQKKSIRTKNATVAQYSVEVNQLTDLLVEKIKENNPKAQTPNFNQWRDSIRLMMEIDGYEFMQIRKMIEWCQSDDFWKSNILSAKKLREKAGTIVLQMQRTKRGKQEPESVMDTYNRLLKYVNGEEEDDGQERDAKVIDIDSIVI